MHVLEYDGKALLSFKQKKKSVTTRSDTAAASASDLTSYGPANSQKQLSLPAKAGQPSTAGTMNESNKILSITTRIYLVTHSFVESCVLIVV
jgi:hypothetical protein